MKRIVRLAALGSVMLTGVLCHEYLLAAALAVSGRSDNCDFPRALDAFATSRIQQEGEDEIRAASRKIEESGELVRYETPMGKFWAPKSSGGFLYYDLAEQRRGIYVYNGHGVKPGDVVVDAGANIGIYAKTALAAGAQKVIAIEPSLENLECLRRNLADEVAAGRVVIVPKGVWDKEDQLSMFVNRSNTASNSFVRSIPGAEKVEAKLPLTTLDQIAADLGLDRIDFIKMDIEGAERKALRGAKQVLSKWKPRLAICVYHMAGDTVEVPAAVAEGNPSYRQECGRCLLANGRANPQVFFFD